MAATQLSDIIDVTVFRDLPAVNSPSKTAFWQSGVVSESPLFNELSNSAGSVAELPFWTDLARGEEANISTDDPSNEATPKKVIQSEQIARKHMINQGWSAANLARDLAMGGDAITHVRNRVDAYFADQYQRRLIASSLGVMSANVADNNSDMVHDVAADAVADQNEASRFNQDAFIEASYTMGDQVDGVVAMAVNSMVMKQMVKQGGVEDVRDADGQLLFRAYMGRRLIVDDNMPIIAGGTDGFKFVSVLFGAGAFAFGEGTPPNDVEIDSNPRAGNGAGVEELWVRKKAIMHPGGYKVDAAPAGTSFTEAELKQAGTWSRVVERKNANIAFMVTN